MIDKLVLISQKYYRTLKHHIKTYLCFVILFTPMSLSSSEKNIIFRCKIVITVPNKLFSILTLLVEIFHANNEDFIPHD